MGDSDENDHEGKKRKLDSGRAVGVGGGGSSATSIDGNRGSSLSMSLKKNYDDMGIDTSAKFVECEVQQEQHQEQEGGGPLHQQQVTSYSEEPVDSSIISRRRAADNVTSSGGYDAFNSIGGMYDFGEGDGGKEGDDGGGQSALTCDSYYATTAAADDAPSSNNKLDGALSAVRMLLEEKNRASDEGELLQTRHTPRDWVKKSIRSELIEALQAVQGDVTDKRFLSSLDILRNFYNTSGRDARVSPWAGRRSPDPEREGGSYGYAGSEVGGPTSCDLLEGNWVNMSRPNYVECLGRNSEDDLMYTLGRMSFDMFQPGGLVCSVQSTHNTIKIIGEREELPSYVPTSLREEVTTYEGGMANRPLLRSYE